MTIRFFKYGVVKDLLASEEQSQNLASGTSAFEFRDTLVKKYPKLSELSSLKVAVNDEYLQNDVELKEGDEVLLIPPVSGG
ncbi:MAG: MoaD/ThiS family protein [Flavobacteriales bacterium]|nr:MoaD/ThiS family protein [Flavobacteriales bacterium]